MMRRGGDDGGVCGRGVKILRTAIGVWLSRNALVYEQVLECICFVVACLVHLTSKTSCEDTPTYCDSAVRAFCRALAPPPKKSLVATDYLLVCVSNYLTLFPCSLAYLISVDMCG